MIIIVVIEKKRIRKVANTIIKFPNKTGMGRIQKTGAKGKEKVFWHLALERKERHLPLNLEEREKIWITSRAS